jgi:hypothetical protein
VDADNAVHVEERLQVGVKLRGVVANAQAASAPREASVSLQYEVNHGSPVVVARHAVVCKVDDSKSRGRGISQRF